MMDIYKNHRLNFSVQVITSKSRSDFAEVKHFQTLYNSTEMGRFKDEVYGNHFYFQTFSKFFKVRESFIKVDEMTKHVKLVKNH